MGTGRVARSPATPDGADVLDGRAIPWPEGELLAGVLGRMGRPDYPAFEAQLRSSGYCARPVRLKGRVEVCDGHGRRQQVWTTDTEPDGILRKACGNRREAICGPCAERYRSDALHLIGAGLRGGKGVAETVVGHPAIFATLTAPGFGAVHAHVVGKDGKPRRCRPRRDAPTCPHGNRLSCGEVHGPDDPCLGRPLCHDCFDYEGAVVWNNLVGELWRRTTIYLPRRLASEAGMTQARLRELVRVSFVKVAEYHHRGLIHLHVLIRLDRAMPVYRRGDVRPPDPRFTSQLLEDALRATVDGVDAVKVVVPAELGAGEIRWGRELDIEQLPTDPIERRRRGGYLAKYSTKSTEQAGGLLHRICRDDFDTLNVPEHVRRYGETAFELDDRVKAAIADADAGAETQAAAPEWRVTASVTFRDPDGLVLRIVEAMSTDERVQLLLHDGRRFVGRIIRRTASSVALDTGLEVAVAEVRAITTAPPQAPKRDKRDRRLAACAHTFGHRGHCLTKSRHWSTTMTAIRGGRQAHVREQLLAADDETQRVLAEHQPEQRIKTFQFVGRGHLTTADAYLAAKAAAKAREHRQLAREALDQRAGRVSMTMRGGS
jgi:hypothetical protein